MTRPTLTTLPATYRDQVERQLCGNVAPTVKKTARESELQKACEQYLKFNGIWYLHLSCRAREEPGCPDLLFVVHGVPVAVELKTATGKLSQAQKETHQDMEANGWIVSVCRSLGEFRDVVEQAKAQSVRE